MKCNKVKYKLNRYADGELDTAQARKIEEHLAICLECGEELQRYRAITDLLDGLENPDPPESFARSVRAEAENQLQNAPKKRLITFPGRRLTPVFARVAASVAVLLGLGIGALLGHGAHATVESTYVAYEEDYILDSYFSNLPVNEISNNYLALIDYGETNNEF